MTKAQPLEAAQQLRQEINEFLYSITHIGRYSPFVYKRLMDEAESLQGSGGNVVDGSMLRASLFSIAGQLDDVERMLRNVEANKNIPLARIGRISYLVNHGYATRGLSFLPDALNNRAGNNLADLAGLAIAAGGFRKFIAAVDASVQNQEVLNMTNVFELAQGASHVMAQLEISDEQLSAMLDVAGESLRAKKLQWQSRYPDVRVLPTELGGPALLFDYRVFVPPQEAATMTWDLTEALVARGLERSGVSIGFLGTALPERMVV